MLDSLSYLRVMTPDTKEPNAPKEVKQEVLKFVGWLGEVWVKNIDNIDV